MFRFKDGDIEFSLLALVDNKGLKSQENLDSALNEIQRIKQQLEGESNKNQLVHIGDENIKEDLLSQQFILEVNYSYRYRKRQKSITVLLLMKRRSTVPIEQKMREVSFHMFHL